MDRINLMRKVADRVADSDPMVQKDMIFQALKRMRDLDLLSFANELGIDTTDKKQVA